MCHGQYCCERKISEPLQPINSDARGWTNENNISDLYTAEQVIIKASDSILR